MTAQACLTQVMGLSGKGVYKPLWDYEDQEGLWKRKFRPHLPKNQALGSTPECLSIRISEPRQKESPQFGLQFGSYSCNS